MTRATISVNVRISTDGGDDGDAERMQRSRNGKEAAVVAVVVAAAAAAAPALTTTRRRRRRRRQISKRERRQLSDARMLSLTTASKALPTHLRVKE